jgi:hypothetical protein
MAVVNLKSTAITNFEAAPKVPTSSYIHAGMLRESIGTLEVAADNTNASVYRMVRVPSGARISEILIANDAMASATGWDLGVYQTAENGSAVVDDDLFMSAVDISAGNAQWTPLHFESASSDMASIESRLWELLSLSADPFCDYDICFTADTVGTGAGTVSLCIRWVV